MRPLFSSLLLLAAPLRAGVVINEFHAAPNEVLPEFDAQGNAHLGYGPSWWEPGFYDAAWSTGTAPIGHSLASGLGTNVGTAMDDKTATLYARRTFSVPAQEAAQTADLIIRVWYDDGFVAYLNGREISRANMGPAKQVSYHHQVSYRSGATDPQPTEYNLGPANQWLVAGSNVLAVEVHNRDLAGSCKLDASLSSSSTATYATLSEFTFDDGNGAQHTHQRTGASATNTLTGTPPPGSWLTLAPDPISDTAWPSLTITTRLPAASGLGGSGALDYQLTQASAGTLPAAMCGPQVELAPHVAAGGITATDLSRVDLSFRYQTSPGATLGFRVDPVPGASAQALAGFPGISVAAGPAEDAPKEFADAANGMRTRTVDASGSGITNTSGLVRYSPTLENGPALRSSAFRYNESNTAAAGANGTTGAIKFELTDAPDTPAQSDWFQFLMPGYTVRGWTAGTVTAADLARVNFNFSWKLPAGQSYRVFLQPDHATASYADRADFGTLTGTGAWQMFDQPFSSATNTGPMLTKLNSLGITAFRVVFRGEGTLPVNAPLWLDRIGFSSLWRTYSINLANASLASQSLFLSALNNASQTTFSPVFTKSSSAISPAADVLTVDDFRVTYRTGGGTFNWVAPAATGWRYFVGRHQASGGFTDPAEFSDPVYDGDVRDWLELHNDGASAVSLTGWHLTDDPALPQKWPFPAGTTIPAGGHLVVMCDNRTTPLAGAQFLHTNFELSTDGEHLTLRDPAGVIVSDVSNYTKQNGWHTWGRDPAGPGYGYLRHGTPGRANSGPFYPARVKTPDFAPAGGFYTGVQTVSILSETPGAVVRYTTDGSDPSTTSAVYTAPLTLNPITSSTGHVLRAKAWLNGAIASETKTSTYLINQDSRLRTAPALIFTGDPARSLYTPYGITSIVGGTRDANGVWSPVTTTDYNNVLGDLNNALTGGQAWERPFNVEWRYADGRDGFNEAAGLRVSGSGHARPRYTLNGIQNAPWSYTSYLEKPSFNIFFRNEYDKPGVSQKLFPGGYPVEYFEQLRVRAGKNDTNNPWVKDEFMRRAYIGMGRKGSLGVLNTLYVNGKFRGIYNTCERLREPFMQQHFNSTADWDVRQVTEIANGDGVAFAQFVALLDAFNASQTQANYEAAVAQLDVPSFIDYALVNVWGGTGDWPHNNYVASRERSPTGKWRWFVWDAEGAFGGFSKHLGYNVITQDFLVNPTGTGREICRTWERLSKNAGFRLQAADRIHQHFCNGGAMTDARLTSIRDSLVNEYLPLFSYILPASTLSTTWFSNWVHAVNMDKRDVLFRSAIFDDPVTTGVVDPVEFGYQFVKANIWPATDGQGTWLAPHPPKFSQHGGDVPAGFQLSILHTEPDTDRTKDEPYRAAASQSPAARVVYYTLDGNDPRLSTGAVHPAALTWSAPVSLPGSAVTVKSRIHDTSNSEWSPLTEASFRIGAQSPTTSTLVIAEIMYNPTGVTAAETDFSDGDEFEFIRLLNAGTLPVRLNEARLAAGIGFDFATGALPVLDPGKSALVVSSAAAFRARYGAAYDAWIAGEYTGTNLSNGGERLRLETNTGATLHDFTYDDDAPWPAAADGRGPSLVLLNPAGAPDHALPQNWIASARPGGLLNPAALPEMTFERWRSLFWNQADAANPLSAEVADWDGDGLTNFAEYIQGTDPLAASTFPIIPFQGTVGGDSVMGIEYHTLTGTSGALITPQYSTDLTTWLTAPHYAPAAANPDGTTTRRAYAPANSGSRAWLRVRFRAD